MCFYHWLISLVDGWHGNNNENCSLVAIIFFFIVAAFPLALTKNSSFSKTKSWNLWEPKCSSLKGKQRPLSADDVLKRSARSEFLIRKIDSLGYGFYEAKLKIRVEYNLYFLRLMLTHWSGRWRIAGLGRCLSVKGICSLRSTAFKVRSRQLNWRIRCWRFEIFTLFYTLNHFD